MCEYFKYLYPYRPGQTDPISSNIVGRCWKVSKEVTKGMQNVGSRILDTRVWNQNIPRSLRKQTLAMLGFSSPLKIINRVTLCDSKRTAVPEPGNCNSKCPVSKGLASCRREEPWEHPGHHCVGSSVPESWLAKDPADTLAPCPWELWKQEGLSVRREIA